MRRARSSWVKKAAGIVLAAFAVLVPPGFGGDPARSEEISEDDTLAALEAKAVQLIIAGRLMESARHSAPVPLPMFK